MFQILQYQTGAVIAGVEVAKGGLAVALAGVEGRWSQTREDLLRVLLGSDGDVDWEIAEGDDDASAGEAHIGEAPGVVDDAADGEHE